MSIAPEHKAFQARLRAAMAEAGLDQQGLATRLESSQAVVSRWLSKQPSWPAGGILARMPHALEVSGHWLLTGEGLMRPLSGAELDLVERGRAEGRRAAFGAMARLMRLLSGPTSGAAGDPEFEAGLEELLALRDQARKDLEDRQAS